jgi:DNA-binding PadR family transcriptional regulator
MPDVSERMLVQRLRELQEAGLVARTEYDATPPRVKYRLTEEGASLAPVLQVLYDWGSARAERTSTPIGWGGAGLEPGRDPGEVKDRRFERERVHPAEPAREPGDPVGEVRRTHVEERESRQAGQVLHGARDQEVAVQLAHVHRVHADRLVGVHEHRRPATRAARTTSPTGIRRPRA